MRVLLSPIVSDNQQSIKFNNEIIQISIGDDVYLYDFSNFKDGKMTTATYHILSAKRVSNELSVEIVSFIGEDAPEEEKFPQWEIINGQDTLDNNAQNVPIKWITQEEIDSTPTPLTEIEKLRMEQAQANAELVQLIMMMGGA